MLQQAEALLCSESRGVRGEDASRPESGVSAGADLRRSLVLSWAALLKTFAWLGVRVSIQRPCEGFGRLDLTVCDCAPGRSTEANAALWSSPCAYPFANYNCSSGYSFLRQADARRAPYSHIGSGCAYMQLIRSVCRDPRCAGHADRHSERGGQQRHLGFT
ncbi:hypothetical protein BC834DRAFT_44178 [Gloeopeniophorella convolvens]|nr:hypothetical protein BC834DRAFT_44178 [Gloeopeniophorella convolvens]